MSSAATTPDIDVTDEFVLVVDAVGHLHYDAPEWFLQSVRQNRVDMPYTTITAKVSSQGYPTPLVGSDRRLWDNYVEPERARVLEEINPELHPDLIRFACDHSGVERVYRVRVIDRYGVNGGGSDV